MCNIAFYRKSERGDKLYLEVVTDSYYIDYATKRFCFHRIWQNDWVEEKYIEIRKAFENGVFFIRVES